MLFEGDQGIEVTFEFRHQDHGALSPKRLRDVLLAFERKLIGVQTRSLQDSAGRLRIVVTVRGGGERTYLGKLWREHLAEFGIKPDATEEIFPE